MNVIDIWLIHQCYTWNEFRVSVDILLDHQWYTWNQILMTTNKRFTNEFWMSLNNEFQFKKIILLISFSFSLNLVYWSIDNIKYEIYMLYNQYIKLNLTYNVIKIKSKFWNIIN